MTGVPPGKTGDRIVAAFVTVTLALLGVLVGLIIYLVIRVSSVQGTVHTQTISACEQSNTNRAEEVQFIHAILALPAIADPQFETPANRAAQVGQVARIKSEVGAAYALHDCTAQYG